MKHPDLNMAFLSKILPLLALMVVGDASDCAVENLYTLHMEDSFKDGWNIMQGESTATIQLGDADGYEEYTVEEAETTVVDICLKEESAYIKRGANIGTYVDERKIIITRQHDGVEVFAITGCSASDKMCGVMQSTGSCFEKNMDQACQWFSRETATCLDPTRISINNECVEKTCEDGEREQAGEAGEVVCTPCPPETPRLLDNECVACPVAAPGWDSDSEECVRDCQNNQKWDGSRCVASECDPAIPKWTTTNNLISFDGYYTAVTIEKAENHDSICFGEYSTERWVGSQTETGWTTIGIETCALMCAGAPEIVFSGTRYSATGFPDRCYCVDSLDTCPQGDIYQMPEGHLYTRYLLNKGTCAACPTAAPVWDDSVLDCVLPECSAGQHWTIEQNKCTDCPPETPHVVDNQCQTCPWYAPIYDFASKTCVEYCPNNQKWDGSNCVASDCTTNKPRWVTAKSPPQPVEEGTVKYCMLGLTRDSNATSPSTGFEMSARMDATNLYVGISENLRQQHQANIEVCALECSHAPEMMIRTAPQIDYYWKDGKEIAHQDQYCWCLDKFEDCNDDEFSIFRKRDSYDKNFKRYVLYNPPTDGECAECPDEKPTWDETKCVLQLDCAACLDACQTADHAGVVKKRYAAVAVCRGAEQDGEEDGEDDGEDDGETAAGCDEACLRQHCSAEDADALAQKHAELVVQRADAACGSAGSE